MAGLTPVALLHLLRPRIEQPGKYREIASRVHRLKVGQYFEVPGVVQRYSDCARNGNRKESQPSKWKLDRGDFPVPLSTRRNRGVLMNQFPLAVSPLEAIGFAHHEAFRVACL
jgi:hypothetical protein